MSADGLCAEDVLMAVLDAMPPPNRGTGAAVLAAELGWTTARVRWALVELRDAGSVMYEPGYRTWSRIL